MNVNAGFVGFVFASNNVFEIIIITSYILKNFPLHMHGPFLCERHCNLVN